METFTTMIYTIETEFKVGDRVNVLNYRKKPQVFEPGEIHFVNATLQSDGSHILHFDVLLDRRVKGGRKNPGGVIWLHVSHNSLKRLT